MNSTEIAVRPIIDHLKQIKGNDLYISGQCLLSPLRFGQFFIEDNRSYHRPIFSLQPEKSKEKLILIMGGDIRELGKEGWLSQDRKTVCFGNTRPSMYIFKANDFDQKTLDTILNGFCLIDFIRERPGTGNKYELCRQSADIGLIQPSVINVIFTATFDCDNSRAGRFTLVV
jgi:hypothetical protein